MYTFKQYLLEAPTLPKTLDKSLVQKFAKEYAKMYNDIFAQYPPFSTDRVILGKVEGKSGNRTDDSSSIDDDVWDAIATSVQYAKIDNNFTVTSYADGTMIENKNPKRILKIGRILSKAIVAIEKAEKQTPAMKKDLKIIKDGLKKFESDNNRKYKLDGSLIVLTKRPEDIATMSYKRRWVSCTDLGDESSKEKVKNMLRAGTIVSYIVDENDKEIDSPFARLSILVYLSIDGKTLFIPGNTCYGQVPSDTQKQLEKTIKEFCKKHSGGADVYALASGDVFVERTRKIEDFGAKKHGSHSWLATADILVKGEGEELPTKEKRQRAALLTLRASEQSLWSVTGAKIIGYFESFSDDLSKEAKKGTLAKLMRDAYEKIPTNFLTDDTLSYVESYVELIEACTNKTPASDNAIATVEEFFSTTGINTGAGQHVSEVVSLMMLSFARGTPSLLGDKEAMKVELKKVFPDSKKSISTIIKYYYRKGK